MEILKDGVAEHGLVLSRKEQQWFTRIDEALQNLPEDEETLLRNLEPQYGSLYAKASYGL